MSKLIFYINGLSDGNTRAYETKAFEKIQASGINVIHTHIRWRKEQDFTALLRKLTIQAQGMIKDYSELIIVGLSAGGSMALNIYTELNNKNVRVITIAGRLRRGDVPPWSYRTMKRAAHLGTKHQSQSFYDSVIYCEDKVLPSLASKDKKNIKVLKPLTDLIVPLHTMSVPGIKDVHIPALGHVMACSVGLNKVADYIKY